MQKITPCLWFNDNAEEAIRFYTSVFKDSSIGPFIRYDAASAEVSGRPEGSFLSGTFTLSGQEFMVLNGGPEFPFTEAISLVVNCADQKEVDYYWDKLTEGGTEVQCGWLKDKFGVSWQVVPTILDEMLCDPDAAKAARVMEAMLKMIKIDIAELKRAYEG
ncbi:MAG TPA: VOC family protein [Candidatus Fimivivens sp.]|nr:VOC family protein [Candidatus Fimivivens sp.]